MLYCNMYKVTYKPMEAGNKSSCHYNKYLSIYLSLLLLFKITIINFQGHEYEYGVNITLYIPP